MRLLSMCSGYGGLDLAVEAALGCETVAFAEVDAKAASVFARHWSDAPNLGDLTAVDWSTWANVDVVCAGFPCQDLSYAGKGAGIVKDSRSGLWYAIEHALGVLRPRLVVLENVAAIVARRPGLDVVLAGLARLGFDAQWVCLRAADVGAPHGRKRWFLVAADARRLSGETGWFAASRQAASGRACGRVAGRSGAPATDATVLNGSRPVAARDGRRRPETPAGDSGDAPADAAGDAGWLGHGDSQAPADAERSGRDGGALEQEWREVQRVAAARRSQVDWGEYTAAVRRWERIFGRAVPHPTDERGRLAPPFVEWMMGLPLGWVTDTSDLSRADMLKILGNGVVPQQAHAAVSALLEPVEVAA